MSVRDPKSVEINIGEIYDQLQHAPASSLKKEYQKAPKKEKSTSEFSEISDDVNENRIRRACIDVSGDIDYKQDLVFKLYPIAAAFKAFKNDSVIYTDTLLMKTAIIERILEENEKESVNKLRGGFAYDEFLSKTILKIPRIVCAAEHPKAEEFAKKHNVSPAMAGFMILKDELHGSVVVIGKDDPSLLGVCRMAERGIVPYLLLSFSAGINTQMASKEYSVGADISLPQISMSQTKGGVETAAACLVELMKIYEERIK
jgi:Precorrin isomerase